MSSSTNTIRPVVRRFPASRKVLEASNLPFAITLTPAAPELDSPDPSPKSLVDIPKCEHCGAPHADTTTFRRLSQHSLLCFLCGKSSHVSSLMVFPKSDSKTQNREPSSQLYKLPLRLSHHHHHNVTSSPTSKSSSSSNSIYEVPAIQCPVLWYVLLDGSCSDPIYWKTMSDLLSDLWKQAPSYVHVALWIISNTGEHHGITMFDLESAVPHLRSWSSDASASRQGDLLQSCAYLTPCDSPHIATAIRSMLDYHPSSSTITGASHAQFAVHHSGQQHHHHPFPLSWICEVILASLDHVNASTAGQRVTSSNEDGTIMADGIKYAGGRIFCLLGDPQTHGWHRTIMPHLGGRGGAIAKIPGERYAIESEIGDERLEDDDEFGYDFSQMITRMNPDEDEMYADVGRRLADAALAIDVLAMSFTSGNAGDDDDEDARGPKILPGFPNGCRILVDRSGAPGPLFFDSDDIDRLRAECLARAPWRAGTVYGAELRLRVSLGFQVSDDEESNGSEQGLLGPGTAAGTTQNLWKFGVSDPYTTNAIDLVATNEKHIEYSFHHRIERWESSEDSNGEQEGVYDEVVSWDPVLQTCFAYTTILSERDDYTGAFVYKTVRRMRIVSRPVPIADTPEALFSSLDTEALAVVLFHKIALAAKQDGLIEAAIMAKQWLLAFLVCVYRSAEEYLPIQRDYEQKGILNHDPKTNHYFFPGERLLDLEGDLSADDVLLAQGHERLRPVSLMVYLLLQSDALRCRRGSYQPTRDLRTAAVSQMSSMTPGTLTRCIAPRLQLWESGPAVSEPVLDVMELRSEAIQSAILEYSSTNKASDLILLLDTPEQIVVMDARYVINDFSGSGSFDSGSNFSGGRAKPQDRSTHSRLIVGSGLRTAIEDAADSYRTPPKIIYELDQAEISGEQTFLRLMDFLIEDTSNVATGSKHFQHWRKTLAREVEE